MTGPASPAWLSRAEVDELVRRGARWRVTYCAGARTSDGVGIGYPLPPGVLERVPTPAALRKRKPSSRTYFYATLTTDADGQFLLLEEP
jgi:hypothetical protein